MTLTSRVHSFRETHKPALLSHQQPRLSKHEGALIFYSLVPFTTTITTTAAATAAVAAATGPCNQPPFFFDFLDVM